MEQNNLEVTAALTPLREKFVQQKPVECDVSPPFVVFVSLIGVKGLTIYVPPEYSSREYPIDRDTVLLPEIQIESFAEDLRYSLKPIFGALWNTCGREGSLNYNVEGKWTGTFSK